MFDYYQLTINSKLIIIMIILKVGLCSFTNADEHYLRRHNRAIGGESLDTSNFILYIDPDGSRFIEVPKEYMENWLHDQKMWRTWSIILAIMCLIFFGILLFFLIHGFRTSTGPFASCIKHINENSSDDKMASSSVIIPIADSQKYNSPTSKHPFIINPHHISALQSSGNLQLK